MGKQRPGFTLYHEDIDQMLDEMSPEEGWHLIHALADYSEALANGEEPQEADFDDRSLRMMYKQLCIKIKRDDEKYNAVKVGRSKGGSHPRIGKHQSTEVTQLSSVKQNQVKLVTEPVSVSENKSVSESETTTELIRQSEELDQICFAWERAFRKPTGQDYDRLTELMTDYETDDIIEAIQTAGDKRNLEKPLQYIKGILRNKQSDDGGGGMYDGTTIV